MKKNLSVVIASIMSGLGVFYYFHAPKPAMPARVKPAVRQIAPLPPMPRARTATQMQASVARLARVGTNATAQVVNSNVIIFFAVTPHALRTGTNTYEWCRSNVVQRTYNQVTWTNLAYFYADGGSLTYTDRINFAVPMSFYRVIPVPISFGK